MSVRFGVLFPFVDGLVNSGPFLRRFLATVEECGADSVWAVEHVIVADDYQPRYPYSADGRMPSAPGVTPMPDPLELLAFAAGVTDRLLLCTGVVVAPLHSPVLLAKRVATVDALSGGRMVLGLGIGWQREEYDALGAPFSDRGARLEEGIGVMRALWAGGPASFRGRFTTFDRVHLSPGPERGTVPIVLGGNSPPALERAARVADGWLPYTLGPAEFAAGAERLRAATVAAGRPAGAVEITAWPGSADHRREFEVDWVRGYLEGGASRLLLNPRIRTPDQLDAVADQLTRYRTEVLDRL